MIIYTSFHSSRNNFVAHRTRQKITFRNTHVNCERAYFNGVRQETKRNKLFLKMRVEYILRKHHFEPTERNLKVIFGNYLELCSKDINFTAFDKRSRETNN